MDRNETRLATGDGRLQRTLKTVERWLSAFDYSSFDYTQHRLERLEGKLGELMSEVDELRAQTRKGA